MTDEVQVRKPWLSPRVQIAITGAMGGLLFGYDSNAIGSVLLQIKTPQSDGGLTRDGLENFDMSLLVSMMLLGAFCGACLAAFLNNRIGRRGVLMTASFSYMVGVIGMTIAGFLHVFWLMLASRVVCGFAVGFASSTTPLYISECAHPKWRGQMVFLNDVAIVFGQVLAASVSSLFVGLEIHGGWRYVLLFGAVPAVTMLILFLFQMPESPRWLVTHNRITEARKVFTLLMSGEIYDPNEIETIIEEVEAEKNNPHDFSMYFNDPRIYRPLRLGMFLQTVQQWVGINTLMYYGALIISKSGVTSKDDEENPFSDNNKWSVYLTIPLAAAQCVGIAASMMYVDKFGRRPAIFASLTVCAIALFSLGGVFSLEDPMMPVVVGIMVLYLISFGAGCSPVPWTVNSEIYPLRFRANCIAIATATNWAMCFGTSFTFLPLSHALSTYPPAEQDQHPNGVFWLYACIAIGSFIILWFYMPETMGLPLEEIGKLFHKKKDKVDIDTEESAELLAGEKEGLCVVS